MKIKGCVKGVAISLVAGILLELVIFPTIASEAQAPEPTPFEVNLDLSFSVEVKAMK